MKKNHTFCVGYYRVLTHNKQLPLIPLALIARIGVAFGSGAAAGASAGSFFGPVSLAGGFTIGGVISAVATCAAIGHELYQYRVQVGTYEIEQIMSSKHDKNTMYCNPCQTLDAPSKGTSLVNVPLPTEDIREQKGCGDVEVPEVGLSGGCNAPPIDDAVGKLPIGCGGIPAELEIPDSGCLVYSFAREKTKQEGNERYAGPWVRNWNEFFETCPVGQQHAEKFKKTKKRNPKDDAPIYIVTEDIPGAEMFKKGNMLPPDRMHGGDHFEVWNEDGEWIGAANVDGSKNHSKTQAPANKKSRSLDL